MAYVQAKCKECGGILAVDDSQETSVCPFCNNQYIVKEAVENYNTEHGAAGVKDLDNNQTNDDSQNTDFIIENDGNELGNQLKKYLGNNKEVVIPSNVDCIGVEAFKDHSIISVLIPSGVKWIAHDAFHGCKELKSVFLPKSLMKIGSNVFNNCISLKSITIPSSVTEIYDRAFANCTALSDITLSKNLEYIDNSAFYNCISLVDIEIPESVSRIGDYAFYQCTSLTDITIPGSVESIGKYAFSSCEFLEILTMSEGTSIIDENAFLYCKSLKEITLPKSISAIGNYAFSSINRSATFYCHENSYAYKFAVREKKQIKTFEEFEREKKAKEEEFAKEKAAEEERKRKRIEEEKAERERLELFFASSGDSVANHYIDAFINHLKNAVLKDFDFHIFGGADKAQWHKGWLNKTMTFPNVVVKDDSNIQLDAKEYETFGNNRFIRHCFDYNALPINVSYTLKIYSQDKAEAESIAEKIKNHFREEKSVGTDDLVFEGEKNIIKLKIDESKVTAAKEIKENEMSAYVVELPFFKYLNVYHFADRSADDIPNNHELQLKLLQQLEYFIVAYIMLTTYAIKQLENDYIDMVSPQFSILDKLFKPDNPNLKKLTSDYKARRPIDKNLFDQTFKAITIFYPFLYNRMINGWSVEQIKDDILKYAENFKKRRDRIFDLLKLTENITDANGYQKQGRTREAILYYIEKMYNDDLIDIKMAIDLYAGKQKKQSGQETNTKEKQRERYKQKVSVQRPRYESDYYEDDRAYEERQYERDLREMRAEKMALERELDRERRRQESQSTRQRAPDLMGSPGCIIGKPISPGSSIRHISCNFACPLWLECSRGSFRNR